MGAHENACVHLHQSAREAFPLAAEAPALPLGETQEEGRSQGEQG